MNNWQIIKAATNELPDPNDRELAPYITITVKTESNVELPKEYRVIFKKVIFANDQRIWVFEKLERAFAEGGLVYSKPDGEFEMPKRFKK